MTLRLSLAVLVLHPTILEERLNAHISKSGALFGIAFSALIAAIVYFVNPESVTSPAPNSLTRPDNAAAGTVERPASALTGSLLQTRVTSPSADIPNPALHATSAVDDKDTALLEDNNQTQLSERDLALPPPSWKNIMAEATGEFSDQINLVVVVHNPAEGEQPADVSPNSHPPREENVTSQPRNEHSSEVNQHALIRKANLEGYFLPDVPADSHPPTGKNVTFEPEGEYAREINRHALMDNAN